MSEPERPVIILFMGEREEHAITSFKHFYPSAVHIITSEKFSEKFLFFFEASKIEIFRDFVNGLFQKISAQSPQRWGLRRRLSHSTLTPH